MGGFPEVKDTRILRYFDTRLACRASIATGAPADPGAGAFSPSSD